MKRENKILIIGMTLYVIPIILFGNFSDYMSYIFLIVSIMTIYHYFYRKPLNKKYSSLLHGLILGVTLSLFGLSPFIIHINKTLLKVSFTYSNILGYWISLMAPIITSPVYHEIKKARIASEFDGDQKKIERDEKIDSLLKRLF